MGIFDIVKNDVKQQEAQTLADIIVPTECLCVKLRTTNQEKVFVNVCISPKVPVPRDISEKELSTILSDIEGSPPFRIPMSIGEGHVETDAAGKACTVYDIIINPAFSKKVQASELFMAFLMTVTIEGLENKYGLSLERNWIVLKNRKSIGRLQEQFVRTSSRPSIVEMESTESAPTKSNLIQEVKPPAVEGSQGSFKGWVPQYAIIQVPDSQQPEFLVVEIHLPKLQSSRGVDLDVGIDCLCLSTRSQVYTLNIELSYDVDEEATVAEFNRDTKTLRVTMPVRQAD